VPTIKPLDCDAVVRAAADTGFVVTVEEGTVLGGLGGAVAETLGDRYPVTVKRLGILDVFGESGPDGALLEKYRLSPAKVAEDVAALLRSTALRRSGTPAPSRGFGE
jgi:transketolase